MTGHRLRGSAFAADMNMRLAEIAHKSLVRFEIDFLITEEKDAMRDDRVMHLLHLSIGKRPRQIDVADFGADMRRTGRDGYGVVFANFAAAFAHGITSHHLRGSSLAGRNGGLH